jgi:probable F420-dependent oxidoreductase
MQLGLTMFATDQTIDPVELAVEAEQRGFSSLWFPEHTHIPTSRATPAPTGGDLDVEYYRAMDPPTVLAACAHATSTLVLGSGISLAAQHDPVAYAKVWATLDHLSAGRTKFGVGFGWNVEEMSTHGVDYGTRRAHTREHVLAMQALWRDDEAEFSGEFVQVPPSYSWPKPLQQPRIPTYIGGGAGPKMFAHIAEYADGWLPIGGAGVRAAVPQLREAWSAAGRDGDPEIVPFGTLPNAEKLEFYREIGCTEVVLRVPAAPRDEVMQVLDGFAPFVT